MILLFEVGLLLARRGRYAEAAARFRLDELAGIAARIASCTVSLAAK
mgnify:CR=1 FL=1